MTNILLTARINENSSSTMVKQKHKLIERIEHAIKSHSRGEIAEITSEVEKIIKERQEAINKAKKLTKENKTLGNIISTLRAQKTQEEYSIEELKKALLDVQDEYDQYKVTHNDNQAASKELEILKMKYKNLVEDSSSEVDKREAVISELQESLRVIENKYKNEVSSLLENNKALNEGYDDIKEKYEFYKENYIEEIKRSNKLQDSNKFLLENIQRGTIKNSELENKLNEYERRLIEYSQTNYSNKGILIEMTNLPEIALKERLHNEQVRCEELKEQLKLLIKHKEATGKRLEELRGSLVRQYDELLEWQSRLEALEKMRLSDVLHIARLESLLAVNNIKY